MLAAGDVESAHDAARELEISASGREHGLLGAIAAYAQASVELAADEPEAALASLRQAQSVWQELDAPYEAAFASSSASLAARLATRTRLSWSSTLPARRSSSSERLRMSRRSTHSPLVTSAARPTG